MTTLDANTPPDFDQRDRISSSGLGETLFVEAGAGTGKTTQLVNRIVHLVLHNTDFGLDGSGTGSRVRLRDIAAITFTEAAAAELMTRIRVAFEKEASNPQTPPALRRRCEEAIADTDQAVIATVHGFASRILGEFPVAAGLPPRITVLDEVASELAHEQRWERFVDSLYADAAHRELLYRARLLDISLTPRYRGESSFKEVASNFAQNWDRIVDLANQPLPPLPAIDFTPFDKAVSQCSAAMTHCSDTSDKLYCHLEQITAEMRAIVDIDDPHRKLRALGRAKKGWGRGRGRAQGSWAVPVTDVKDCINAVNDSIGRVVQASSQAVVDQMIRLTAREVLAAAEARRASGGLEFHDLLVLARSVLRTNAEVRNNLHRRYRYVLLDEFQDTDPIQIELASLIAASPGADLGDSWQDHPIEPGRLFFVGDPKQSIYRFRRADIELFLNARSAYAGDDPVRLSTNFRTVAPIIDWVNGVFAQAMPDEVPKAQPRYEPLEAFRSADSGADHRPVVLGGEHPDPKVKAGPLREAEANDVAAVIAQIEANPAAWPVHVSGRDDTNTSGADNPRWRPATLSDITILIPTRTSLPYLREALERYQIRYRLATGTLVYDTQEVRDVLATLRAIDDPLDKLSLVAALRSPLFGCSDVDLFTYSRSGGRWDLRSDPPQGLGDGHPVVAALGYLRGCWHERWWLGPANLLERIVRERSAMLIGFGDRRPVEVWRRLRFLLDQARHFEESFAVDLRGFLDWADLQSAEGARVHEPLLPETDDDAVSILTVHGAKGLEFPITILSGMTTGTRQNRPGVSVLWGPDGSPQVKLKASVETAEHAPRADIEEEMSQYEKLRLLYVAATRAQDHLIVSGHHKQPNEKNTKGRSPKELRCETFAGRLADFALDHAELSRTVDLLDVYAPDDAQSNRPTNSGPNTGSAGPTPPDGDLVEERNSWTKKGAEALERANRPGTVSATAIARSVHAEVIDVDDDAVLAGSPVLVAGSGASPQSTVVRRKGRAGSAIGRAVHGTLELIDFGPDRGFVPPDLDRLIDRQCHLETMTDSSDTVAALVRSALRSDAVDLARRNRSHRELYVAAPIEAVVIEGYVDLLIEGSDGLVVVDYKTDAVRTPAQVAEKVKSYELQAAAYAVALEISTGLTVAECRFVFCTVDDPIEVSLDNLQSLRQQLKGGLTPAG